MTVSFFIKNVPQIIMCRKLSKTVVRSNVGDSVTQITTSKLLPSNGSMQTMFLPTVLEPKSGKSILLFDHHLTSG